MAMSLVWSFFGPPGTFANGLCFHNKRMNVLPSSDWWTRAAAATCDGAAHLQAGAQCNGRSSSGHHHQSSRRDQSLAETASRLLFSLLSWVSRIPAFTALPHSDQVEKFHGMQCGELQRDQQSK